MPVTQGTINYPTQLHLVGHFRKLYHDVRKLEYQAIISFVISVQLSFLMETLGSHWTDFRENSCLSILFKM